MTAEPMPRIASAFDRLSAPSSRPTPAPCADCAPERDAAATREAEWRRAYGDLEADAAALRRELARLRRSLDITPDNGTCHQLYPPAEGDQ